VWVLVHFIVSVLVPLDIVAEDYRTTTNYFMHLKTIGTQFGIFRDVFGTSFLPKVATTICYGSQRVHHGNILEASKVLVLLDICMDLKHRFVSKGFL